MSVGRSSNLTMIGSLFYRRSNSNSSLLLLKDTLYRKTREYWSKLLVINIIQVQPIVIALYYFLFPLKHNYKIPWKVRFCRGETTTDNTYVNITESRCMTPKIVPCIRPCCKPWFHPWCRMLKRSPGLNQLSWVFFPNLVMVGWLGFTRFVYIYVFTNISIYVINIYIYTYTCWPSKSEMILVLLETLQMYV